MVPFLLIINPLVTYYVQCTYFHNFLFIMFFLLYRPRRNLILVARWPMPTVAVAGTFPGWPNEKNPKKHLKKRTQKIHLKKVHFNHYKVLNKKMKKNYIKSAFLSKLRGFKQRKMEKNKTPK